MVIRMSNNILYNINSAVSEVGICNKALRFLGVEEIVSLSQNSKQAELCSRAYFEARNELLSAHYWSFATRYTTLPCLDTTEASHLSLNAIEQNNFQHAYKLPTDCLAVQGLADNVDFLLGEGGILYTNAKPARAILLILVSDPINFPPLFVEALAKKLAASLAISLVNSTRLEEIMSQRFEKSFEDARLFDANQENIVKQEQDTTGNPWIMVR